MLKKSFRIIFSSALAVMMLSIFAYAQQAECKHGAMKEGKHGEGFMKMMKELNLTQDQKAKLQKEHEAMQAGRGERRAEMKAAYSELQQAIDSKASDAVIKDKTAKLEAVKEKVKVEREKHLEVLKSVLTPEQYAKVSAKMQDKMNMEPGECMKNGKGMADCCKDGKGKADCCKEGKGKAECGKEGKGDKQKAKSGKNMKINVPENKMQNSNKENKLEKKSSK